MASDTETQFGALLRKYRKDSGLSQTELVDQLGIHGYEHYDKSSISKWEGSRTKPPPDVVETLEDILGVRPGLLLKAAGYHVQAQVRREEPVNGEEISESHAGSSQYPKTKRPLQVLVGKDVLEVAPKFKNELSCISALDDAVWQLRGAPWLSSPSDRSIEFPSVMDIRYERDKLKVDLKVEKDERFLLLLEWLKVLYPEFENFEQLKEAIADFVSECQEITREIWYQAQGNELGLKMGVEYGYGRYGYMINVPLFIYEFALEHCAESSPPEPELELSQVDVGRFPDLPPHYWQLTPQGRKDFLLAAGLPQVMDSCGLITTGLCKQYAQDDRIKNIIEREQVLKEEIKPFRKALSEFLPSFMR